MKPINKTLCGLSLLAPLAVAQNADAKQRPNILFFLVDDFGWTETSLPFGEETYPNNLRFRTPNMERLAKMGVMMTNAYACSVSTPTRTCLMRISTTFSPTPSGTTTPCARFRSKAKRTSMV